MCERYKKGENAFDSFANKTGYSKAYELYTILAFEQIPSSLP